MFFPVIDDALHNVEQALMRPLLDVLHDHRRYAQLIQKGARFVLEKEEVFKRLFTRLLPHTSSLHQDSQDVQPVENQPAFAFASAE